METTTRTRPALTEYSTFDQALQSLTGADFANAEAHPGALLNQITGDDTTVYVWWPVEFDTPCLAWESPRGWSAVVVDSYGDGWANELWFTRATNFGHALLSAPEPTTLRGLLISACDRATDYNTEKHTQHKQKALAWGLRILMGPVGRDTADKIAQDYACTIDGAGTTDCYRDFDSISDEALRAEDLNATRPLPLTN